MFLKEFRNLAKTAPERLAVVAFDEKLTYRELDRETEQIADCLRRYGVRPNSVVGLYLPRRASAISAILGAMRAGTAYAFFESDGYSLHTLSRVAGKLAIVLTDDSGLGAVSNLEVPVINIDSIRGGNSGSERTPRKKQNLPPAPSQAAYVLYTSGSSGAPKGAIVTHGNLQHYISSIRDVLQLDRPLQYAHASALSADLGNTCIFLSLSTGGVLHILDNATRKDAIAFVQYLRRNQIEFLKITPSHWKAIRPNWSISVGSDWKLRYLVLGGETLTVEVARIAFEEGCCHTLVNHYGPTETTIGVAVNVVQHVDYLKGLDGYSVPVGRPLGKTVFKILDKSGVFRTADASGELYIGGPSVGAGYLGESDLTRRTFVTTQGLGNGRYYKTGDQVYLDTEGTATFLGRLDRQVKISGHRVELGDVEDLIRDAVGLTDVACHAVSAGEQMVIGAAMVTLRSAEEIRKALTAAMPLYMVPSLLITAETLPRTSNGKIDHSQIRTWFVERARSSTILPSELTRSGIEEVGALWRRQLRLTSEAEEQDDFFQMGGNSLDVIELIAELQRRGYHNLTVDAFLRTPTLRGLIDAIGDVPGEAIHQVLKSAKLESRTFSESQDWFFSQAFHEPNHWNQSVLLESTTVVDPLTMTAAIAAVVKAHPLLRTSYVRDEFGMYATTLAHSKPDVSQSSIAIENGEVGSHILAVSEEVNRRIDIETGRVFACHIFRGDNSTHDQILLVCHHLSVDAVSWKIIVSDLVHVYRSLTARERPVLPQQTASFWDWVDQSRKARPSDIVAIDQYSSNDRRSAAKSAGALQSVWLILSESETRSVERLPRSVGIPSHVAVFGAFLVLLREMRLSAVRIDIESHGRDDDYDLDLTRLVGWFTSVSRVKLDLDDWPSDELLSQAVTVLDHAYLQQHRRAPKRDDLVRDAPMACFNYLGRFDSVDGGSISLEPSRFATASVRSPANSEMYDFRLTCRVVREKMAIDLTFSRDTYASDAMLRAVKAFRTALASYARCDDRVDAEIFVEGASSTGRLYEVPESAGRDLVRTTARSYENVLLTGATGYVGSHLLLSLLEQTSAKMYCLVRPNPGASPDKRIRDVLGWYWGERTFNQYVNRINAVSGDICDPNLGLKTDQYSSLCSTLDAVYHLASDTRLVGAPALYARTNIAGMAHMIKLVDAGRITDLHYMSTLAVSGYLPPGVEREFSEYDLDIGQSFMNEYEHSKFEAEKLALAYRELGGRCFIYRAGNVSGHSQTGKFQCNSEANRFTQILRAVCSIGLIPSAPGLDGELTFAPVDQVAEATVSLSLGKGRNTSQRTYHILDSLSFRWSSVIDELSMLGFTFKRSADSDLLSLLERHVGRPEYSGVSAAYFWLRRPNRNIIYRADSTDALLRDLPGKTNPARDWLAQFLRGLVEQGSLWRSDVYIGS